MRTMAIVCAGDASMRSERRRRIPPINFANDCRPVRQLHTPRVTPWRSGCSRESAVCRRDLRAGAPPSPCDIAHSARLCLLFHKPDRPTQCRTGIWADTSCGLRREIILWPDMSLGVLRQTRRKERQSTPAFLPQARVNRHPEWPPPA
jgi:hypothetical protein